MALGKLPYKQLRILLKDHLVLREDPETAKLIRELKQARRRGYLTPAELERICRWKSARAIHHIKKNSAARVRTATWRALATLSERRRFETLMSLDGVSVAMASAILTLLIAAVTASSISVSGSFYTLSALSARDRAAWDSRSIIGINSL